MIKLHGDAVCLLAYNDAPWKSL